MDFTPNGFFAPSKRAMFLAQESARLSMFEENKHVDQNIDYADEDTLRVKIAHMREDVSASLLMQGMIHRQLVKISQGIWALLILVVIFVLTLQD